MKLEFDNAILVERIALLSHPLFESIHSVEDVRVLMEIHVYAVWDFMTLLKRIQRELTCVELPWMPPRHREAARLINEIVIGEESDELPDGHSGSHLDLYLAAMNEIGADTSAFHDFLGWITRGAPPALALTLAPVPAPAGAFIAETLKVAQHGSLEQVLAYFFFGREDIIPGMFRRLLESWSMPDSDVPMFSYYLKRHIEMDGDAHGPAAHRLLAELLNTSEQQQQLLNSARAAIRSRIALWDGVLARLRKPPGTTASSAIGS
ncbi:mangotoxin biosynthesis-involved protein MgoB [Burkholderia ubonensis]|nr:mangotoxin biosynthesis-involved protein MgoB [Burkholderia ubonensis]